MLLSAPFYRSMKLSHRDIWQVTQGHTANKRARPDVKQAQVYILNPLMDSNELC